MHKDEIYHSNGKGRNNDAKDSWPNMPEIKINKKFIFRIQLTKEFSKTRGSHLIFTTQGFLCQPTPAILRSGSKDIEHSMVKMILYYRPVPYRQKCHLLW